MSRDNSQKNRQKMSRTSDVQNVQTKK